MQAVLGVKLCKEIRRALLYSTYTRPKLSQKNAGKIDYSPIFVKFCAYIA